MTEDSKEINRRFLKQQKEVESLEFGVAREMFESIVDSIAEEEAKENAMSIFDAFGLKYSWTIIDIFMRIKHLPTDGGPPRRRPDEETEELFPKQSLKWRSTRGSTRKF